MTREKAIEMLEYIRYTGNGESEYKNDAQSVAIDMAIKALEQKPCEDCVSRQAVDTLIDELARAISDERCCVSRGRSTATIMQDILDLPSVIPKGVTITDFADKCRECGREKVLDKIRAEIDDYLYNNEFGVDYRADIANIIDKYKESEVQNNEERQTSRSN